MAARGIVVALAVAVALAIGACFTLNPANGTIACSDDPNRPCPSGYSCIQGRCWTRNPFTDGGGDGGGSDGGRD